MGIIYHRTVQDNFCSSQTINDGSLGWRHLFLSHYHSRLSSLNKNYYCDPLEFWQQCNLGRVSEWVKGLLIACCLLFPKSVLGNFKNSYCFFPPTEMAQLNSYDSPDTPETDDSAEVNKACGLKDLPWDKIPDLK